MGRALQHRAPLVHERVAGADSRANLRHQHSALARHLQNFAERHFEIFLDVVSQGLQRGNIENFCAIVKISGERLADQAINAGEKSRQRFPRTGGSRNKSRAPGQNVRPSLFLRLGRRAKALDEPIPHQRVRPGQGRVLRRKIERQWSRRS